MSNRLCISLPVILTNINRRSVDPQIIRLQTNLVYPSPTSNKRSRARRARAVLKITRCSTAQLFTPKAHAGQRQSCTWRTRLISQKYLTITTSHIPSAACFDLPANHCLTSTCFNFSPSSKPHEMHTLKLTRQSTSTDSFPTSQRSIQNAVLERAKSQYT